MKVKMQFYSVSCYLFVFTILEVAVKSQMSSNSNSHSFISDNSDVRYLVDNIPVTVHKEFTSNPGVRVQSAKETAPGYLSANSNSRLKFEPPALDFKQRHLGVPHHEKVTVMNLDGNKTVYMSSISGNTVHFHSSFFDDKIIPPLGNTSFNVVFLGREEGEVENYLFIHTSEGTFKYDVKGASIGSPYRLRPLSGVRLPLNASYSPVILMHNPHDTPLQLVEVYSSGGEFHLELPGGEMEGAKQLWEIPAFLTKPVIRVRFDALAHRNHTAYIRLKINASEEVLVVPVEVEVGAAAGLYSASDLIDFGIGGLEDPPTQLPLMLSNSGKKPIRIQNIISTPVSKSLKIDFEPIKVPPDTKTPIQVAMLTYDWRLGQEPGVMSGRVVVKVKGGGSGQKLVIPYTATVLAGGLQFDPQATSFRSDCAGGHQPPRSIVLTNNYQRPLAITNVTLRPDANKHFQLSGFRPVILAAGEKREVVVLGVSSLALPTDSAIDSALLVHSNVSTLTIPLLSYNGRLNVVIDSSTNETRLKLGLVGIGSRKEATFAVENRNPVPVLITSWGFSPSLPSPTLKLVNVLPSNSSTSKLIAASPEKWLLSPGGRAIFRLELFAEESTSIVGEIVGFLWLKTEFETVLIDTTLNVQPGSLHVMPQPILFDDCFPGKVCVQPLVVHSRFGMSMRVESVTGGAVGAPPTEGAVTANTGGAHPEGDVLTAGTGRVPSDARLTFVPSSDPRLLAHSVSNIGHLHWDIMANDTTSYLGLATDAPVGGIRWADTMSLPVHTRETDISLLTELYERYINASARPLHLALRLDTTEVRGLSMTALVHLSWPRLVNASVVQIPLTQVGNTSYVEMRLVNPATQHATMVQLVLETAYPMVAGIVTNMPKPLRPECIGECIDPSMAKELFVLSDGQRSQVASFLLPPAQNITVKIGFSPTSTQPSSALLLVRNNLTALEAIHISAQGAYAQFKFGNRKPGSNTPLLFELAEKHLKDCERERHRKSPAPNLTVKRSFTARNTGALPLSVYGFYISGLPCEGYGFKVLNCQPFQLAPNSTRKVDIAFTPDFTLARVQRLLTLWTSEGGTLGGEGAVVGGANYTLVATLPPYLLAPCAGALARPTWEPLLYYSAVTFMIFLLCCVLAAAYLESDRTLKCALIAMSRSTDPSVQPVLDLRFVAWGGNTGSLGSGGKDGGMAAGLASNSSSSWMPNNVSSGGFSDQEPLMKNDLEVSTKTSPPACSQQTNSAKKRQDKASTKRNSGGEFDEHSNSNSSQTVTDSQRRESWANVFNSRSHHLNQNMTCSSSRETKRESPSLSSSNSYSSTSSSSSSASSSSSSFSSPSNTSKSNSGGGGSNHQQQHTTPQPSNRCPLIPILRASDLNNRKSAKSAQVTSSSKGAQSQQQQRNRNAAKVQRESSAATSPIEDESSSTTTESSHDDGEKDLCKRRDDDERVPPILSPHTEKPRRATTNQKSEPIEEEIHAKKANRPARKTTNKTTVSTAEKAAKTTENALVNGKQNTKVAAVGTGATVAKSQNGNRGKDKPALGKRRTTEKVPLAPTKSAPEPGAGAGLGGVIRASFSDVVARTTVADSYSSIVAPRNQTATTATATSAAAAPHFVTVPSAPSAVSASMPSVTDASNQGPQSALGPIGPKKLRDPVWKSPSESPLSAPPITTVSSSLFTDSFCDNNAASSICSPPHQVLHNFDTSVWATDNASVNSASGNNSGTNPTSLVLKVLQDAEQRQQQQQQLQHQQQLPLSFKETWGGVNSLWEPLYTPAATNPSPPLSAGPVRPTAAASMWGSDVWAPGPPGPLSPPPPVLAPPHTPWAPPGLAPPSQQPPPLQQNAAVANQSLVRGADIDGLDYHPFRSLSNIWSPSTTPHHHSTIWQPPTSN